MDERTARSFARVAEINAELAERAERRREDGSDIAELHQEHQEQERAADRPQPRRPDPPAVRAPQRNWQAEQKWVEQIVAKQLEAFARGLAAEVARIEREQLTRLRREFEDRIAESDEAVVALMRDLENRVAELEQRAVLKPIKPKLVAGGADG